MEQALIWKASFRRLPAFSAAFQVENQNGIDDLRLAMLQAQLARFPASGHVLHFIDWAKIELTKDTLGRYIPANPCRSDGANSLGPSCRRNRSYSLPW